MKRTRPAGDAGEWVEPRTQVAFEAFLFRNPIETHERGMSHSGERIVEYT